MRIHRMVAYTLAAAGLVTGLRMVFAPQPRDEGPAPDAASDATPDAIPFAPKTVVTDVRAPAPLRSNIREEKRVRAEARTDALRTTLAPLQGEAVYVQGVDDPAPAPPRPRIPGPGDLRR